MRSTDTNATDERCLTSSGERLFSRFYNYLAAAMQMDIIGAIAKGVLIGLFMAISVGPTLFAVIKYSLSNSYKAGLAFVIGVSVSDIMYVTIANVAASWLVILKNYTTYISYGGAALLVIVGLIGLIKKGKPQRPGKTPPLVKGHHYVKIWASGFLINTINPGVMLSWLAAVTASVDKSSGYRFILFSTCLALILGIDFLKVFLAEKIRTLLTPRRLIYTQKVASGIILFLGLAILIKTLISGST